jgi:hypothetical protein
MEWKRELRDLIERARTEGKWLWCSYQDLWFSPNQLAEAHREGRFMWGVVNWKLRDPQERVQKAAAALRRAEEEFVRVVDEQRKESAA